MENLILSANVIAPLLILLSVGVLLNKINLLGEETIKNMNNLVSVFLLPLLVFSNIYSARDVDLLNINIILFSILCIITEFFVAFLIAKFLTKKENRKGVVMQGMFRSNFLIFGLPIAISLYGDSGAATSAVLTMFVIPLYNILAVISLEMYNGGEIKVQNILKKLIKNPLIIASILGILVALSGLELPTIISKPLSQLSSTATPLAFVFLGATFKISSFREHLKELSVSVFVRLIGFPLIIVSLAIALGFRGALLATILTLFASPTAVSSFSLSQSLGGDGKLAGNIVIYTSVISIITMFIWIFVLKTLAFI